MKIESNKICAIDFDGTCVTHDFPLIGEDIGAVPWLLTLTKELDVKLVLFTMRSKQYLDDAVNWFKENEIPLWGINRNPEQDKWTSSPKAYAQLYVDDAAAFCPLVFQKHDRGYVDWTKMGPYLLDWAKEV